MLRKKTTLYMVNRAHVFYEWISWELCDRKESYGSFVTNIFNGTRWDDWICLSGNMLHVEHLNWNNHTLQSISDQNVSGPFKACGYTYCKWMAWGRLRYKTILGFNEYTCISTENIECTRKTGKLYLYQL